MTKAELIFYEMTDREIFSRAKTVYEKLGIDFDALSDEEAKEKLPYIKVIARATPNTKLRIVRLAQELGLCVGMTGDGTNDAPALKAADVGFSMGSGTDVCKEAGDIIITDDNFVSITDAVLLSRTCMLKRCLVRLAILLQRIQHHPMHPLQHLQRQTIFEKKSYLLKILFLQSRRNPLKKNLKQKVYQLHTRM